jgi:hypothetical protein
MLGRKSYTRKEFDHGKAAVDNQLAAYAKLAKAVASVGDKKLDAALKEFDSHFCNTMTLLLDRYFVHRLRVSTGKDGNPLNEVEMLCDGLINNDDIFRQNSAIKLIPDESVAKVQFGERIQLTSGEFERLAAAFFTDLRRKFV